MTYAVTWLTMSGNYRETFTTRTEANNYATKLKKLNETPGHAAVGIKVTEI